MQPSTSGQNNTCLHLFSRCKNNHIKNLRTNQHKEAIHILATTLLAHPWAQLSIIMNASKSKDKTFENIKPSWFLPCMCYLPICNTCLRSDILCIIGAPTKTKLPFTPNPKLKVKLLKFTYCTNRLSMRHHPKTEQIWLPPTTSNKDFYVLSTWTRASSCQSAWT